MPVHGLDAARVVRFVRAHAGWVLFAPVLTFAGTWVHELAHAAAAVATGGRLETLRWYPGFDETGFYFGRVSFVEQPYDPLLTWLAPAMVSFVGASAGPWLVERLPSGGWAKAALLALFVLPMIDLSMAAAGLAFARPASDWFNALAGEEWLALPLLLAFFVLQVPRGYRAFVHACGPALSSLEFTLGASALWLLAWLRWAVPALAGG